MLLHFWNPVLAIHEKQDTSQCSRGSQFCYKTLFKTYLKTRSVAQAFFRLICDVAAENKFCFRWTLAMSHHKNEYGMRLKNVRPTTALLWHVSAVLSGANIERDVVDTRGDCGHYRGIFHELYSGNSLIDSPSII